MSRARILIAGIGNVFLGDDAFGVEVVQRLARRPLPAGVRAVDFGIRGIDLAYALSDGPELAILVDALPRGGPPGTLYLLAPDWTEVEMAEAPVQPHGLDPVSVLRLVKTLGGHCPPVRIVGCEPAQFEADDGALASLSR